LSAFSKIVVIVVIVKLKVASWPRSSSYASRPAIPEEAVAITENQPQNDQHHEHNEHDKHSVGHGGPVLPLLSKAAVFIF
jgi:hypothetical protein